MEIREATPDDAETIREVHAESIVELAADAYRSDQVEAWASGCASADYRAPIMDGDVAFVVADRGGAVVGFGSLRFGVPEDYEVRVDAEVTGIYVDPSVVRTGVGSALYGELEARARERGVTVLGLSASLNAVEFYESLGFVVVRRYRHEFSAHESTGVMGTVVEMYNDLED